MDPTGLSAVAIAALVRYLASRTELKVGKAVDAQLQRVYAAVKRRVEGEKGSGSALAELEVDPGDPRRQGRMEYALEQVLREDPDFGQQLKALVDGLAGGRSTDVHVTNSGAVSVEGDVNINGQYASGRDLKISPDEAAGAERPEACWPGLRRGGRRS